MRKYFSVLITILFFGLSLLGCISQIQPVATTIITIEPTVTHQLVEATRGEGTFLPTFTLAPVTSFATPYPSATSTPLPRDIFDPFPMEFYRNTVKTNFGVISIGSVIKEKIFVDNTLIDIYFTLAWKEGDLDLYLIQPDGVVIDSSFAKTEKNISFKSDSAYKEYSISSPQIGIWTMVISNKSPLNTAYKIEAHSETCAMRVVVHFGNENNILTTIDSEEEYVSGGCIKLSASIEDLISLTREKTYVHNAVVRVVVKDPRKDQYSFELFDDGFHGDGKADDGIYATFFCNTKIIGEYFFDVQISGVTNWNGGYDVGKSPFTRETIRSIVVH